MTTVLIFGADVAGVVRGPSADVEGARLEPIMLTNGLCFLPLDVLEDPAHQAHHGLLMACERVELEDISNLLPVDEE